MVFSTNCFSSLATSLLNASLSAEQSKGRRSCALRHVIKSFLALSTAGSICSNFFRVSSLVLRFSISLETEVWLNSAFFSRCAILSPTMGMYWKNRGVELSESEETESLMVLVRDLSFEDSFAESFSSSEVTRDWIFHSRLEERVVSDCSRQMCFMIYFTYLGAVFKRAYQVRREASRC
jgi:hypothetical protein